jgi:uncharacterized protein (DUF2147 family)
VWLKDEVDGEGLPKKGKNGQKLMGLIILKDFVFEDDEWTDGTIYDPESGKTYYATMELDDRDELDVRGSVDPMGWIGRTDEWTRVE